MAVQRILQCPTTGNLLTTSHALDGPIILHLRYSWYQCDPGCSGGAIIDWNDNTTQFGGAYAHTPYQTLASDLDLDFNVLPAFITLSAQIPLRNSNKMVPHTLRINIRVWQPVSRASDIELLRLSAFFGSHFSQLRDGPNLSFSTLPLRLLTFRFPFVGSLAFHDKAILRKIQTDLASHLVAIKSALGLGLNLAAQCLLVKLQTHHFLWLLDFLGAWRDVRRMTSFMGRFHPKILVFLLNNKFGGHILGMI